MTWAVHLGDCRDVLATMESNSIDAVCTDPPYELTSGKSATTGFMGKAWDGTGIAYNVDLWREVLRVLKPGGYVLSFGGARTYHRMVVAIEDAGFVIHPLIAWVFGSGFPKATSLSKAYDRQAGAERAVVGTKMVSNAAHLHNDGYRRIGGKDGYNSGKAIAGEIPVTAPATALAQQWDGWYYGRQSLKPALEPICMAQKPHEGRMTDNVAAWGTGGINIAACRVGTSRDVPASHSRTPSDVGVVGIKANRLPSELNPNIGRWPKNLLHDGSPEVLAEFAKAGERPSAAWNGRRNTAKTDAVYGVYASHDEPSTSADTGSAARFFMDVSTIAPFTYHAKASRAERNAGLDGMPLKVSGLYDDDGYRQPGECKANHTAPMPRANHHPTVKPIALCRYLCRLITPPGGLALDPFAGSGSIGIGAILEGFQYIGIEMDPEYVAIAEARLRYWAAQPRQITLEIEAAS